MTRAATFTQGDISRLAKGLRSAGFANVRVSILPTGEIIGQGLKNGDYEDTGNSNLDDILDAEEAALT